MQKIYLLEHYFNKWKQNLIRLWTKHYNHLDTDVMSCSLCINNI